MINRAVAIPGDQERAKAVQDVQRYAAAKIYYISSIPTGNVYTMLQPRVQNYDYSLSIDFEGTESISKLWLAS